MEDQIILTRNTQCLMDLYKVLTSLNKKEVIPMEDIIKFIEENSNVKGNLEW